MRLVFAGTPEVAIPSLEAIEASQHKLVAVVTRPPAAQGRSSRLVPSAVHAWGDEHGLEVLTPGHPRDPEFLARLSKIAPECAPVVAYGALIPQKALDIPRHGWVNLHFSLLPAYRGAAPVQRSVMAGETVTGATTFEIVKQLDAGPVYAKVVEPIGPLDTAGDLFHRLSLVGAKLLVETLDAIENGRRPTPQADDGVSHAAKVEVGEVRLDWAREASELASLVRGASPDPGAWTTLDGLRFKVLLADVAEESLPSGRISARRTEVLVGTASTALRLLTVQPLGKRPMAATDWARGARLTGDEAFE